MTVYAKLKWILGILLVFGLVLATNLIDRNNFISVRDSIVSIYEDRLIANDVLFDMAAALHQKELAFLKYDPSIDKKVSKTGYAHIEALLQTYEQTKLTEEERLVFKRLKEDLAALQALEQEAEATGQLDQEQVHNTLAIIQEDLLQLSKIQLTEGRIQMLKSNETLGLVELYTRIEIIFLVVLAVLLQIIVLYKPETSRRY